MDTQYYLFESNQEKLLIYKLHKILYIILYLYINVINSYGVNESTSTKWIAFADSEARIFVKLHCLKKAVAMSDFLMILNDLVNRLLMSWNSRLYNKIIMVRMHA